MATGGGTLPPDRGKQNNINDGNKMEDDARDSYMYVARDAPPYRVYIEIMDNTKRINKFSVGSMLRKMDKYRNHMTELKYLGRNKIIVFFNSWVKANMLVGEETLREKGYKAYIPRHLVCITGVIGGIPMDIEMEDIQQDVECMYSVVNVYRLNRWDREQGKKVASNRVSVTFRSNKLPESMKVFGTSVKVQPYVRRFVFCENCHRFGHRKESCKSNKRCERCSRIHTESAEECQYQMKCLHCRKTDHRSTDPNCPSRQREVSIKTMMSKKNLTYVEARELVAPVSTQNMYDVLADVAEYPPLPNTYAMMTAGRYAMRSNNVVSNQQLQHNNKSGEPSSSVNIREAVFKPVGGKRQKIASEHQQLIADCNEASTLRGTGLNNKFAANDKERWESMVMKATTDAEEKATRAVRGELANFYSALFQMPEVTEDILEKIKECSKKFLNLNSIIA